MDDITELTERLRASDSEQFNTLVRMHLSFVLDLNTDEGDGNSDKKTRPLKWNLPFAKKTKSAKIYEGSQLPPNILKQTSVLIEFLKIEENIVLEGIFRRTGKLKRQQELKAKLIEGCEIDLSNGSYSVHDCASVLKTLLSELPEPLLTDAHFPAYCQVAELKDNSERLLLAIQLLSLLLPNDNRIFVREILTLLQLASQHEGSNRMSSMNLATLFTPHLMCPRRLTPEQLHIHSQLLSSVVAFMIQKAEVLFNVPVILATDIRAYWDKKERRQRSPLRMLNESVCDGTTVSTVFTFVDREKTAQENVSNPTELALAQLYAHIQSLPDSAMKRRLVKNFNKKNGQGTPAVRSEERKHRRSRSLRDSIKKHLPGFNKGGKGSPDSPMTRGSSPERVMKTPLLPPGSTRSKRPHMKQELLRSKRTPYSSKENAFPPVNLNRSRSCDALNSSDSMPHNSNPQKRPSPNNIESLPAKRTPPNESEVKQRLQAIRRNQASSSTAPSLVLPTKRPSSPKTLAQKLGRSPPNVASLSQMLKATSPPQCYKDKSVKFARTPSPLESLRDLETSQSRSKFTGSKALASPFPCTPLSVSSLRMQEHGLPCTTPTNRIIYPSTPRRFPGALTTSTPAPRSGCGLPSACLLTPHVERNSSMSPITRSAQRMPRAMQETMMTPRSRKPVVSLSGTDLCHLTSMEPWTPMEGEERRILEESEGSDPSKPDSLSTTFRDYLFSRSVLTASPVDLSFSSRTDDFQSLSSKSSSLEDLAVMAESAMKDKLSESLLFCLDGNNPETAQERSHICETAI